MIGHVKITTLGAFGRDVLPQEQYGILLVNYDAPSPKPKIYRVPIEGRSGTIDMTEWAGDVFYEDRQITLNLRDMHGNADRLITDLMGRRCNVFFDRDDPGFFYQGRVESIKQQTRLHVTNITVTITCHPFKYPIYDSVTYVGYAPNSDGTPYNGTSSWRSVLLANSRYTYYDIMLYQSLSYVTITPIGFVASRDTGTNKTRVVLNGTTTIITGTDSITLTEPLKYGVNRLSMYNAQDSGDGIRFLAEYQNRVM